MKKPQLSIVIPVYNVEGYLAYCLESVLSQSGCSYEVLCVDDGSTDQSGELLALAACRDERVRVIQKPNGGPSSARNAGIDAARGRYLCFLDADDRLLPQAAQTIAAAFGSTQADVVTYGAEVYPSFWAPLWVEQALSPRDALYEGFASDLLFGERSHPFAWRTACRREFLMASGVRFDETISFGEDQVFHFELYPRSARTALIANKLVSYRVSRKGSLMYQRSADPVGKTSEHIKAVSRILNDWDQNGFLRGREQVLFDWIIEFVGVDILSLGPKERLLLAQQLRVALAPHFSAEFIDQQLSHRVHGFMVQALFFTEESPYAGGPQRLRLRYYGARDGWRATLARSARALSTSARERVRALSDALAHARGLKSRAEQKEAAWEAADATARAQATNRLRARPSHQSPAFTKH